MRPPGGAARAPPHVRGPAPARSPRAPFSSPLLRSSALAAPGRPVKRQRPVRPRHVRRAGGRKPKPSRFSPAARAPRAPTHPVTRRRPAHDASPARPAGWKRNHGRDRRPRRESRHRRAVPVRQRRDRWKKVHVHGWRHEYGRRVHAMDGSVRRDVRERACGDGRRRRRDETARAVENAGVVELDLRVWPAGPGWLLISVPPRSDRRGDGGGVA